MIKKTNNRFPAQVSKEFLEIIKETREKARLKGKEISLTDITREIARIQDFKQLQKEVLKNIVYKGENIKIRFD